MADPLSIVASVVALAGAAHKISKGITYLQKLGEVPGRAYVLRNEVTDLELVLKQVVDALQQNDPIPEDDHLMGILDHIKFKLTELSVIFTRIGEACERNLSNFIRRRAVWAREKAQLENHFLELRALKESLSLVLGCSAS